MTPFQHFFKVNNFIEIHAYEWAYRSKVSDRLLNHIQFKCFCSDGIGLSRCLCGTGAVEYIKFSRLFDATIKSNQNISSLEGQAMTYPSKGSTLVKEDSWGNCWKPGCTHVTHHIVLIQSLGYEKNCRRILRLPWERSCKELRNESPHDIAGP